MSINKGWSVVSFRVIAVGVVLALLLTACGGDGGADQSGADHGGEHGEDQIAAPVDGAPEATLTAVDIEFEPATLELTAGEPLNLTIVNDGEAMHDFTLDEAGIHVNVEPGESKTTSLTIDEPGSYQALCTVEGHADAGMTVEVVVS